MSKKITLLIIIVLVLIGVSMAASIIYYEKLDKINLNLEDVKQKIVEQKVSPQEEPVEKWVILLPNEEVKVASIFQENSLLFATKEGKRVTLYKRNLRNGEEMKIFEYEDVLAREKLGVREDSKPMIALSPDKKSLAYVDPVGFHIYDLETAQKKTLIYKTTFPTLDAETPPEWSLEALQGTYYLKNPKWSSDGRFISLFQLYYEGSKNGIIDFQTGEYFSLKLLDGQGERETWGTEYLTWSPVGNSIVMPGVGGDEPGRGLSVSLLENISRVRNLAEKFGHKDAYFYQARFSPNGQQLVFTYQFERAAGIDDFFVATVNIDGTGSYTPDRTETGKILSPFFSSDGNSIFYIKVWNEAEKSVLINYYLNTPERKEIILPSEFLGWENPSWIQDGYLSLEGSTASKTDNKTRLLVLDLKNKKVIYASPNFSQFTTFLGFAK